MRDVHIWYRETESLGPDAIGAAEATLSADERTRCDRFHFSHDRRDYAVAHDLLRRSLSRYSPVPPAEWRFDTDQYGKPSIKRSGEPSPSFSLSHTRGLVACAIASGMQVGVDVERVERNIATTDLAERYFSPDEAAALRHCHENARTRRFAELWTLKEAYIKAIGLGLSQVLAEFSFELDEDGSIGVKPPPRADSGLWHFAVFAPSHHTRLAVAVRGNDGDRLRFIARGAGGSSASDDGHRIDPLRTSVR